MSNKNQGWIFVFLFFIIIYSIYFSLTNMPQGFMSVGLCNETNKNSEVCWCADNQDIKIVNETRTCVDKNVTKEKNR